MATHIQTHTHSCVPHILTYSRPHIRRAKRLYYAAGQQEGWERKFQDLSAALRRKSSLNSVFADLSMPGAPGTPNSQAAGMGARTGSVPNRYASVCIMYVCVFDVCVCVFHALSYIHTYTHTTALLLLPCRNPCLLIHTCIHTYPHTHTHTTALLPHSMPCHTYIHTYQRTYTHTQQHCCISHAAFRVFSYIHKYIHK